MKSREKIEIDVLSELMFRDGDVESGEQSYKEFIKGVNRDRRILKLNRLMRYAAAVIITLIVNSSLFYMLDKNEETDAKLLTNEIFVPLSQRLMFTLEDGTKVWLNSETKLTYPSNFSKDCRAVQIKGEAYFEVARDEDRPFIVTADDVNIEVLGTTFNVSNYDFDNSVKASLIEGSVKVMTLNSSVAPVVLKPNQQIEISSGGSRVEEIPNLDHFLWIDGIYAFENEKLSNILDRFEMYFNVDIVMEDRSKFESRYTGKFRHSDGIYTVLDILQTMHDFDIEIDRQHNVITLK